MAPISVLVRSRRELKSAAEKVVVRAASLHGPLQASSLCYVLRAASLHGRSYRLAACATRLKKKDYPGIS